MCLKVEGTARSSHRSHLKQDHLVLFSLWRSISISDAFLCSSKQIPMPGLCLCKPLGRVCVFLFVPHLYYYYYCWHNLISTGPDELFWICWSSCRIGPWIINVYGHLLTWSWLITRSILWSFGCPAYLYLTEAELLLASQYCSTQYHKYKISLETPAFLILKTILNQPSQTNGLHFSQKISGVAKKPNEMGDRPYGVGRLTVS